MVVCGLERHVERQAALKYELLAALWAGDTILRNQTDWPPDHVVLRLSR